MSVQEHKAHAPVSVSCFVLTVSDTRTEANDTGGQAIRQLLETGGHTVTGHAIVRDDPAAVVTAVNVCLADAGTRVIITTGGDRNYLARRHVRSDRWPAGEAAHWLR